MSGFTKIVRIFPTLKGLAQLGTALALSLLVSGIVSGVRTQGWLQVLELEAYDTALAWHREPSPVTDDIVLVAITEADIQGLARWPLTDERMAGLLEAIVALEPAAVGLDIFRDQPVGDGHELLDEVLRRHPEIVVVYSQPTPGTLGVPPPRAVADRPERIGFSNVVVDPDGKVRRGLLIMGNDKHGFVYSLGAQVAFARLARDEIYPAPDPSDPNTMQLGMGSLYRFQGNDGSYVGADDGEYQYLLDYRNADARLSVVDMWSVLEGNVQGDLLAGRVVLVGVTAESVKDEFLTPARDEPLFGVELHAQMVAQLLRTARFGDTPARPVPEGSEYALIVVLGLLGAVAGVRIRRLPTFLVAVGVVAVVLAVLGTFTLGAGVWLPTVPAMLAWLASAMGGVAVVASFERRERAQIYRLFSRFCSREVVDEIRFQGGELLHPGYSSALQATVMFTDVVGLTTTAEQLDHRRLMTWLNEYVSAMMPLVYQHDGIVIRLVGDAIMAAYGVPVPRTDSGMIEVDARNAVRTALAMDAALVRFNQQRTDPIERVAMRIGIATGMVAGGVLGDSHRQEYNIHGDVVNIAARLEQLDKERFRPDHVTVRTRILITGDTLRHVREICETELYAQAQLRNLAQTTQVHEVLGLRSMPATPGAAAES